MQTFVLERSHIVCPGFGGRGFILEAPILNPFYGYDIDRIPWVEVYLSRDAITGIQFWLTCWEGVLQKNNGWRYNRSSLIIGDFEFLITDRHGELPIGHFPTEEAIGVVEKVKKNYVTGFEVQEWSLAQSYREVYESPSLEHPGYKLHLQADDGKLTYDRVINDVQQVPKVVTDLTQIRIAEKLLAVANATTNPVDGYQLELKLGFGQMDLTGGLNRSQLRELAERLIP